MNKQSRRRLADVALAEQRRLAGDPNIVGVGFGLRRRGGVTLYEACIQYLVKTKLTDSEAIRKAGSQPLPEEVEGYPTDVLEEVKARPLKNEGPPTGSRGSHIENPLIGGTSTTVLSDWHSFPTGFGTIGGLCFDSVTGAALALSNAHVWGMESGKDCIQPWMPTGEYLEAAVKLLTCGPAAFILDGTVPSPLTIGLGAAAAAAWTACAASDSEDPSRWGQRTQPVPPASSHTTAETIRIAAGVPDFPFAGREYKSETRWDYTRHTTGGDTGSSLVENRINEHVLLGKLVRTERDEYRPGEHVRICAEVISERTADPRQYFVVAICYPNSNPDHLIYRVLRPGRCGKVEHSTRVCLSEFPDPLPSGGGSFYTINLDPFRFESAEPTHVVKGPANTAIEGVPVLQLPPVPLRVVFPPCTRAEFSMVQMRKPVTIIGRNSAGRKVASVTGTGSSRDVETLVLEAPEMVEAVISSGREDTFLSKLCVSKNLYVQRKEQGHRLYYLGDLDIDVTEKKDRWNIVLQVQTVDPSAPQADPIAAARILGGVTASANVCVVGCVAIMLLDHVFDVI